MKSPWHAALVWPDPDWKDAESRLYGLGRLERLLLTLATNGVGQVILFGADERTVEALGRSRQRERLPALVSSANGPLLAVRSGALFDTRLLPAFAARLDERGRGILYTSGDDSRPALFSIPSAEGPLRESDFESAARHVGGPHIATPAGHVCVCVKGQRRRGSGTRELWLLTSKPVERWPLRQVRLRLFPLTAALASRGVRPSTVTWVSFWIALAGCALLAFGGYAGAIAGAVALYVAWVLDVLDGALSRLSFQASAAGAKLDTDLGRIAYALTAAALGWAVYAPQRDWKQALLAASAFTLGGYLSIVAGLRADRMPPDSRPRALWRLRTGLDHLLHRDNTLILLACAVADRLSFFLWLLIALLHVSWVVDALVLLRSGPRGGSPSPPRVPPDPERTSAPQ